MILMDQPLLEEQSLPVSVQKWYPVCGCEAYAGTGDSVCRY